MQEPANNKSPRARRIEAIDLFRGLALVAMAIYHFAWDLEFFGYADPGMTAQGGWKLFARCIASSFLFLAGVSLFLAHGRGVRWEGFRKRFAMVAGAALAISVVTYLAVPGGFIFFGILHQIAFASLAGLLFLRLPALAVFAIAAAVVAAPFFLRSQALDHPAFWWLGLSSADPRSNDYVPVFPWFGAVLAGMGAAKLAAAAGLFDRLAGVTLSRVTIPLQFAGRHSLAVYLIHQPVLIGCLYLLSQVAPPAEETREVQFLQACQAQCAADRDGEFCSAYCVCMLDGIESAGRLDEVFSSTQGPPPGWLNDMAGQCTMNTEASSEGETP